ncbi:biopolymer transporter ExbD [Hymenobacter cellulosilyticus]|uniref:Biopolymer transporter ExbD n=1 Tax=Hymenobacter cellulosilyticus TaxID=2932248 RepID=A0A8T9QHC7_9BACT|nr:biopolymer transporter ExbD [Hymenobacter cellulosilyticus]
MPRPTLGAPDLGLWGGVLLLLSAFFLTSSHFAPLAPAVRLPFSFTPTGRLPESHALVVSIDSRGRFYLATDNADFQTTLLEQVARQYGVALTQEQLRELRHSPFLSQDIHQLHAWLAAPPRLRHTFAVGIPSRAGNDQLADYLTAGLAVSSRLYGKKPFVFIRADQTLPAARLMRVFRLLQQHGIHRLNLVANEKSFATTYQNKPVTLD